MSNKGNTVYLSARCTRSGSQHDIGQDNSEAQEGAAGGFAHRTAGAAGAGGPGSTARAGGGSRAGGLSRWEGGRNDRGSGGDGNGGGAFFDLVIDPSNERPQVGILYVVGKAEQLDALDWTGEILRRGEVLTLCVDDDCVPIIVLGDGGVKIDCAHALTCGAQNQREGRVLRIR